MSKSLFIVHFVYVYVNKLHMGSTNFPSVDFITITLISPLFFKIMRCY